MLAFIEKHAAQTGGPADLMLSDMTFKSSPASRKPPGTLPFYHHQKGKKKEEK